MDSLVPAYLYTSLLLGFNDRPKPQEEEPNSNPQIQHSYRIVEKKCSEYSNMRMPAMITNGIPARLREFPHMAAVGFHDGFNDRELWDCGGTLISEWFVLSAAHCTSDRPAKWVRLGDLNLKDNKDGAVHLNFRIARKIIHPEYKQDSVYHDIALFKLERKVPFSSFIRPICLDTGSVLQVSTDVLTATGWGMTGEAMQESEHLLKTTLKSYNGEICQNGWYRKKLKRGFDAKKMICAGDYVTSNDTCGGDSGGPLKIQSQGKKKIWYQIGITSHGHRGCKGRPAIYTKVSGYIQWIQKNVWPEHV